MMAGCTYYENPSTDYRPSYKIIYLDTCEYLVYRYKDGGITHKGDCKYCAYRDSIKWEKRKQELIKEIKEK